MNEPSLGDCAAIRRDLRELVDIATRSVRAARVRDIALRCVRGSAPALLLVGPTLSVLALLIGAHPGGTPSGLGLLVSSVTPPLLYLGIRTAIAWRTEIPPLTALALADRRLGLDGRLAAAHEFIARDLRGPFEDAAVRDAARRLPPLAEIVLETGREPLSPGRRSTLLAALAGALALLALSLDGPLVATDDSRSPPALARAGAGSPAPPEEPEVAGSPQRAPDVPGLPPRAEARSPETQGPEGDTPDSDLARKAGVGRGRTRQGSTAQTVAARGGSSARGTPSSQANASTPPREKRSAANPKPRAPRPEDESTRRTPPQEAGGTAGRGTARGSHRSPAASPWRSRDQVVSDDEAELEKDEDVEDEDSESEARGGVQPALRDRKPPVNRDLSIGFGNQKNPDANGRGGPSEQKKSRGVASLVLGVPIPDHVKGTPNPGRTKITQERVEPNAERAQQERARWRRPRAGEIGPSSRMELRPWMRELVGRYFRSLRERQRSSTGEDGSRGDR